MSGLYGLPDCVVMAPLRIRKVFTNDSFCVSQRDQLHFIINFVLLMSLAPSRCASYGLSTAAQPVNQFHWRL